VDLISATICTVNNEDCWGSGAGESSPRQFPDREEFRTFRQECREVVLDDLDQVWSHMHEGRGGDQPDADDDPLPRS